MAEQVGLGDFLARFVRNKVYPMTTEEGVLEYRSQVLADIQCVKPTHVFNAAGVIGRPNVDWCESHRPEAI